MTITLAPRDAQPNVSPRKIEVNVVAETAYDYKGVPTHNPSCPVLTWPKFAWVEVDANYGDD